jgi:hypothetical protein
MRNKIGLFSLILWVATIAGAVTLFVRGHTTLSPDGRLAVILADDEKDMILGEMRGMLQAVADITRAIAREDHAAIAAAAKVVGTAAVHEVPPALLVKIPLEFKRNGLATHAGFDRIETAARTGKPIREITAMLGDHLGLCTGCHAGYRFALR